MAATTIEWSSFSHSTNSLCLGLHDVIITVTYVYCSIMWMLNVWGQKVEGEGRRQSAQCSCYVHPL